MLDTAILLGMPNETVGDRIRRCREAGRLSQNALGQRVGVTGQTIWQWEKGERNVRPENQKRLAEALGVSVSYLLFGRDVEGGERAHSVRAALRARNLSEESIRSVLEYVEYLEAKYGKGRTRPEEEGN